MDKYGIYGNCVTIKGDPNIMAKSQESVQDRFGLGDNGDEDSLGYDGDGSIFPFRDNTFAGETDPEDY